MVAATKGTLSGLLAVSALAAAGPAAAVEGVTEPADMMFVGAEVTGVPVAGNPDLPPSDAAAGDIRRFGPRTGVAVPKVNTLIGSLATLREIYSQVDPNVDTNQPLRQIVQAIRNKAGGGTPEPPQGMRGLGAIPAQVLFALSEDMAQNPGGVYSPNWTTEVLESRGQILDYRYGDSATPGLMKVETWVIWQLKNPGGRPVGSPKKMHYLFTVEVGGGFRIKDRSNDANDIFPGTGLQILGSSANAHFTHKVWAKGSDVRVTELGYDRNGDGDFADADEIIPIGSTDPEHLAFQPIFATDDDNCVDMMVAVAGGSASVPRTYQQLTELGGHG